MRRSRSRSCRRSPPGSGTSRGNGIAVDPARSFERVAGEYEAARPSYPPELLDALPLDRSATVLDLGAGTGKLTRILVERYARVIAVEPLAEMREILERVVPAAESLDGAAEAIPLPDAAVEAVFAAQAFHWFANHEAILEIARVLRPGGVFAVVWNEGIDPSPLPEAYQARIKPLFEEVRAVTEEDRYEVIRHGPFGELREESIEHEQAQTRESALAFMRSTSVVAKRPPGEREALMTELGSLLPEGRYVFRMRTAVRWAVRS